MWKRNKREFNPKTVYGVTPVNSTAARVLGVGKKKSPEPRKARNPVTKRAIEKAQKSLERAQWERENYKR